mmetsp:Transcript_20457/g.56913  ORF Transcript_20457/g.56913 Transcript_20457/m.56913 type:complete len:269 (-) Transcript_20457:1397-2203(-)
MKLAICASTRVSAMTMAMAMAKTAAVWTFLLFGIVTGFVAKQSTQHNTLDQRSCSPRAGEMAPWPHRRTGRGIRSVQPQPTLATESVGEAQFGSALQSTTQIGSFFEEEVVLSVNQTTWTGMEPPSPKVSPEDIPTMMMTALKLNDNPTKDAGLLAMWAYAGDTTRFIFNNNETDFVQSAHETAENWPTSFYGVAFHGRSWMIDSPLNRVGGIDGWIATQVMKTVSSDGRVRRWQWELRKKQRPPQMGCWYVESIGSSDRKGNFEADN